MVDGFTEKENEMVRLENVEDVLFQALLLDDVRIEFGRYLYVLIQSTRYSILLGRGLWCLLEEEKILEVEI